MSVAGNSARNPFGIARLSEEVTHLDQSEQRALRMVICLRIEDLREQKGRDLTAEEQEAVAARVAAGWLAAAGLVRVIDTLMPD